MKSSLRKHYTQSALTIAGLFVSLLLPAAVLAQAPPTVPSEPVPPNNNIANNVCKGVLSSQGVAPSPTTTVESCQQSDNSDFSALVRQIINLFSVVVGAVSVIMIIVGGFRYIISGGDSAGVSAAKNTILYAVVGLVIVLFAQVIVRFILTNATRAL